MGGCLVWRLQKSYICLQFPPPRLMDGLLGISLRAVFSSKAGSPMLCFEYGNKEMGSLEHPVAKLYLSALNLTEIQEQKSLQRSARR